MFCGAAPAARDVCVRSASSSGVLETEAAATAATAGTAGHICISSMPELQEEAARGFQHRVLMLRMQHKPCALLFLLRCLIDAFCCSACLLYAAAAATAAAVAAATCHIVTTGASWCLLQVIPDWRYMLLASFVDVTGSLSCRCFADLGNLATPLLLLLLLWCCCYCSLVGTLLYRMNLEAFFLSEAIPTETFLGLRIWLLRLLSGQSLLGSPASEVRSWAAEKKQDFFDWQSVLKVSPSLLLLLMFPSCRRVHDSLPRASCCLSLLS